MAHSTFKLQPGVQEVETPVLNSAGISQCQLIRFKPDSRGQGALTEKLGGWAKFFPDQMPSNVRCLHAWQDLNNNRWVAAGMDTISGGTEAPLNVLSCVTNANGLTVGQQRFDITPVYETSNGTSTFSTTANSPVVAINDSAVGSVLAGSTVFITTQVAVGGIVLFGAYPVLANTGLNSYTIVNTNKLGQPAPALSSSGSSAVPSLTTTNGSASVQCVLTNHGYSAGDTFPLLNSSTIGGITFTGDYIVASVIDANTFTFLANASATSSVTASVNGGNCLIDYALTAQPPASASGYGLGGFGLGGYGTGQTVTVPPGIFSGATDWSLSNWGDTLLACPIGGSIGGVTFSPICQWSPVAGAPIAVAIPQAPVANYGFFVAMPQRQIVAYGSTWTGIPDPLLVRWCDVNDFTTWIGTVTNQAGSYRLTRGSKIVGGIQGPQQGLLWTDLGVWTMQYIGPPNVYGFNEVGVGCGLIGRKAAAILGGTVYWMSQAQFFKLDANGVSPIDCPIWDVVFQNLAAGGAVGHIRAAANSLYGEVAWYYPAANSSGEVTNYVKYNTVLNTWDYGVLDRSAWIDQSVVGPPLGASPSTGYIYQHEISPDADNQPMVSSFTSGMFSIADGDQKTFIDEIWPDMKWGYYSSQQSVNLTLTFFGYNLPNDTPVVYGPFALTEASGPLVPRIRARLLQVQVQSADAGSWWRMGGMRYRGAPDGRYG